jgi:hypothetical protein
MAAISNDRGKGAPVVQNARLEGDIAGIETPVRHGTSYDKPDERVTASIEWGSYVDRLHHISDEAFSSGDFLVEVTGPFLNSPEYFKNSQGIGCLILSVPQDKIDFKYQSGRIEVEEIN